MSDETLITDQGCEFVNELCTVLNGITNTEHRNTSAYHPQVSNVHVGFVSALSLQTNGLTERFNQTLSRCLAKIVNESQSDWDDKIDTFLMGYRASRQSSTKFSPYYMMFQQEMRLPIDTEFLPSDLDAEEGDAETVDHTIEYLPSTRQTVFQKADSNIASAQKHQTET